MTMCAHEANECAKEKGVMDDRVKVTDSQTQRYAGFVLIPVAAKFTITEIIGCIQR